MSDAENDFLVLAKWMQIERTSSSVLVQSLTSRSNSSSRIIRRICANAEKTFILLILLSKGSSLSIDGSSTAASKIIYHVVYMVFMGEINALRAACMANVGLKLFGAAQVKSCLGLHR